MFFGNRFRRKVSIEVWLHISKLCMISIGCIPCIFFEALVKELFIRTFILQSKEWQRPLPSKFASTVDCCLLYRKFFYRLCRCLLNSVYAVVGFGTTLEHFLWKKSITKIPSVEFNWRRARFAARRKFYKSFFWKEKTDLILKTLFSGFFFPIFISYARSELDACISTVFNSDLCQ